MGGGGREMGVGGGEDGGKAGMGDGGGGRDGERETANQKHHNQSLFKCPDAAGLATGISFMHYYMYMMILYGAECVFHE